MSDPTVVFPADYREGATIYTPHGPVTVGKHRKTTISPEQHADLLARHGNDYFGHDAQGPTDEEQAADGLAALTAPSAPPAIEPSEEYERYASAHEAASRAHARGQQHLHDTLAAKAAASANTSDTGEARVDLGGGVVGGGRSAALSRKAERAKTKAAWDADAAPDASATDAEPKIQDEASA